MQALQTLLQHVERERDDALAALRTAEDGERRARAQAEQLARYRAEYDDRWGARAGRAGPIELLHCAHGFMQRIDQAAHQQQRSCDASVERAAAAREALQARELRVAAVRKLIERRVQAARLLAERHAQKLLDEAAQRVAWAARGGIERH